MIADVTTLADLTWPMQTRRTTIRPCTDPDLAVMWQYRRLDSVGMWMTDASKDLDAFLAKAVDDGRVKDTLVVEVDGRLVGDLMVRVESPWSQGEVRELARDTQAEIGWCLDPVVQGQGYGTEVATALLRIGFAGLGLRRLIAQCFAENEPSWRIMERIGMRRESYSVRDGLHRDGTWRDGMLYALLAEEWHDAVG